MNQLHKHTHRGPTCAELVRSCQVRGRVFHTAFVIAMASVASVRGQSTRRVSLAESGVETAGAHVAWLTADGRGVMLAGNHALDSGAPTPQALMYLVNTDTLKYRGSCALPQIVNGDLLDGAANGRHVLISTIEPLVTPDANGLPDLFVLDLADCSVVRVSENSSGAVGDQGALDFGASISDDGRRVAFLSYSSNFVSGNADPRVDVYVKDLVSGTVLLASVSPAGDDSHYPPTIPMGNNHGVQSAEISGDGRHVAFVSIADNLSPMDSNGWYDVFVFDVDSGLSDLISVNANGVAASIGGVGTPAISDDGRFVAFASSSPDLVPAFDPGLMTGAFFVRDRRIGSTQLASWGVGSVPLNAAIDAWRLCITPNGRYVLFGTYASNVVPGDTNGSIDVFLTDMWMRTTVRASLSASGAEIPQGGRLAGLSDDGSRILFIAGSDVVPGDTNNAPDAFLHDRTLPVAPAANFCLPRASANGCTASLSTAGQPDTSGELPFFLTSVHAPNHRIGAVIWSFTAAAPPYGFGSICVAPPMRSLMHQTSAGNPGGGTDCSGFYSWRIDSPLMAAYGWTPGVMVHAQLWIRDPTAQWLAMSQGLTFTTY